MTLRTVIIAGLLLAAGTSLTMQALSELSQTCQNKDCECNPCTCINCSCTKCPSKGCPGCKK